MMELSLSFRSSDDVTLRRRVLDPILLSPSDQSSTPTPISGADAAASDSAASSSQLVYNSSVFVAGLLLLERSAESFIKQVSLLSTQSGISPTLIALLTAGAEWEELVVVIASISHSAPSLAIANVIGSSISNILGAFSLGIIFAPQAIKFDQSAKRFSIIQAGITTVVISLILLIQLQQSGGTAATKGLFENVVGVSLIIIFILYFVGLSWAISRGILNAPEASDSEDSSSESDDNSAQTDEQDTATDTDAALSDAASSTNTAGGTESEASLFVPQRRAGRAAGARARQKQQQQRQQQKAQQQQNPPNKQRVQQRHQTATSAALERTPLLLGRATSSNIASRIRKRRRRATLRALYKLVWVLLILSLSGYLLSHSILELAELLHLSDTVLGLTLLSFATTVPEKMLSVIAGLQTGTPNTGGSGVGTATHNKRSGTSAGAGSSSGRARSASTVVRRSSLHDEPPISREEEVATTASSILMAGAAGSNVFLLTLCLGISLIFDKGGKALPTLPVPPLPSSMNFTFDQVSSMAEVGFSTNTVKWQELVLLEVSSLSLVLIAYTDGQRWQGVLLLLAYVAFLVAEFTIFKR